MYKALFTCFFSFIFYSAFAQGTTPDTVHNLGFEVLKPGTEKPLKWTRFNSGDGYECKVVTDVRHNGQRSLLIQKVDSSKQGFLSMVQAIPAKYKGDEIEFKAWLKYENVENFMGLLIRIDDTHRTVEFQSMQPKKIHGTSDWHQYSIKAKIPAGAQKIYIADILGGGGKLWMDDAEILIDGKDISQAPLNADYDPNKKQVIYGNNAAAGGTVQLKTTKLYYETHGSGEPLLLLHGDSQSIEAFDYQIDDFSKKYKVIAVDTRGQGKSTDETSGPLSYDLFAQDMKDLLDSLHINKVKILGWSDGGNTGLTMAIKYPHYVDKLATMGANLFPTNDALPDTVLNEVKKDIEIFKRKDDAHSKMEVRLFTMMLTEPHISFEQLKTIKCPVLVMAGQHDLILEKHTKAIAATILKSQLVIFQNASHYAPVEIPEKFNETVLNFMGQ